MGVIQEARQAGLHYNLLWNLEIGIVMGACIYIYIYYIHLMLSIYVFFTIHLAVLKNKLDLEHVHQNSSSPDLARAQG